VGCVENLCIVILVLAGPEAQPQPPEEFCNVSDGNNALWCTKRMHFIPVPGKVGILVVLLPEIRVILFIQKVLAYRYFQLTFTGRGAAPRDQSIPVYQMSPLAEFDVHTV